MPTNLSKDQRCVRCANGDTRTPDGFHALSTGKFARCADLPPYEQVEAPTSNLVTVLKAVERQLDRYREALIEAQDGLGDGTDPDDVRARIYLALRENEYTGDRLRAEIERLTAVETSRPISEMDRVLQCLEHRPGEDWRVQVIAGHSEQFWHALSDLFAMKRTVETAAALCACGEFCNASLQQLFSGKCRRVANGLPVKASGERCGNWPCQLPIHHAGPCCSSPENGTKEHD